MKIALISLALLTGVAHAEVYYKSEMGATYYTPSGGGVWYQENHPHELNKLGQSYGLGIGYRNGSNWSYELTYRAFRGGSIYAEWEHDDTYFSCRCGPITGKGESRWKYDGLAFDALYHWKPSTYLKVGFLAFSGYWNTSHIDLIDDVGSNHTWIVEAERVTPSLGIGYRLNDYMSIEATYYLNINMSRGSGVDAATTLNIVVRY